MKTVIPERRYAMIKRKFSLTWMIPALGIFFLFLRLPQPEAVSANEPAPTPEQGSCMNCHEDLYFLHDTGNWYCLREAPMSCVDCHGGDPFATSQEQAHLDRAAHPVINDDISKCQECHPQECAERMQKFDQVAGISDVLVAMPYTPRTDVRPASIIPDESSHKSEVYLSRWKLLQVLFLTGAVLAVFFLYKKWLKTRKHL
jgi:hypothetical protein